MISKLIRLWIPLIGLWLNTPSAFSQAVVDPIATLPRALMPSSTLASLPAGNFLENMWVDDDNSLLITNYLSKELLRWRGSTGFSVEARLEGHPVSISKDSDGMRYLAVHGQSFKVGPVMLESQRIVRLYPDGKTENVLDAPQAKFLNGMAWLSPGRFLVADSLAGTVWLLDIAAKTLTPWLVHDELKSTLPQRMVPGANGIHIVGKQVWISNSSRRLLMTVDLKDDFTAGDLQKRVEGLPIDDFAVAADGSILAATHRQAVLRLRPNGTHEVIAESADVNDSTAIRFGRGSEADKAFVITSGGAFAGRSESVQLIQLKTNTKAAAEREPIRRSSNLDMRMVLALKVNNDLVQKRLPVPWQVAPVATGPSQGSNLSLIFVDRIQVQDGAGAMDLGGSERSLVVTAPGKHPITGEQTTFPILAYSDLAKEIPGPYSTTALASISRNARTLSESNGAKSASENWLVRTTSGRSLNFSVDGRTSMPSNVLANASLRSPKQSDFMRIYRVDQYIDWWRSTRPDMADRVTSIQLKSDIDELAPLLNEQAQVLSVAYVPVYRRQVFVP